MANCLQVPMASCSFHSSSSSSSSLSSSTRPGSFRAVCSTAKVPVPSVDHDEPFIKRLFSFAAQPPEKIKKSDTPPLLDLFDSPDDEDDDAERLERWSWLPDNGDESRIVFITMPLVSKVTERVIFKLMSLQLEDPRKPIYIYINSSGTTLDDDTPVGMEKEGFAIYEILIHLKNEIYTVNMGRAVGQACLLLSAGTKGKRFSYPHARAMIQEPRVPPSGLMPASYVKTLAREAIVNRDTFVELFAKHTGMSEETVATKIKDGPFYMDAMDAKEFGVIDQIIY